MSYCFQETVIVIRYIFPLNPRQQYLPGKQFSIFILPTATLKSSSCYSSSSFASLPNPKLLSQAVGTSVKTWIKSTSGGILLYHYSFSSNYTMWQYHNTKIEGATFLWLKRRNKYRKLWLLTDTAKQLIC